MIQTILDERFGDHARHRLDLFVPEATNLPLLLCVHGGWWTGGNHEDLRPAALRLASLGVPVALLGHRILDDGARHGIEMLDDLVGAAARAVEAGAALGCTRGAAVAGSGSGSLLALLLAGRIAKDRSCLLRAVVLAGVTASAESGDLAPAHTRTGDRFTANFRGALNPVQTAPAALPPLLALHGEQDAEVPLRSAQRIVQRQTDAGCEAALELVQAAGHHLLEAQPALCAPRIAAFLAAHAAPAEELELFTGAKG